MRIPVLILFLSLTQAPPATTISGTWEWQGAAGWQRIILTLKADGSNLTGVLRMGPGSHEPQTPAEFWEYFFDPVDFSITNGKVSGNSISFEHIAVRSGPIPMRAIADNKFVYKGVVQANEIVMTREAVSDPKDDWAIGTHKVEFVLKRVKGE